jgi:diamine N-acetyltransferase
MTRDRATVLRDDVSLRPLTLTEAPATYRWVLDPAVADNIGLRSTPSLEKTRAWIERSITDDSLAARAILVSGDHVGNVVLDRIDRHLDTARLSIYIGESSGRGRGVGLTAVVHALRYAFETLHLNKVWLTVHCRNAAALKVYVTVGFAVEGVLRDEFMLDGQRLNVLYMGLLASEFNRLWGPQSA